MSSGQRVSRLKRTLWTVLGIALVSLGVIGALLPLLPTTIFLILAAACFARSSPRLEARLLGHPRFGPTLRAWRKDGAIGRRAKIMACAGMVGGFALFWWRMRPDAILIIVIAAPLLACAWYVVSRPLPREGPADESYGPIDPRPSKELGTLKRTGARH